MRAFKFFDGFHGNDARAWLLTIVRNTCYTWLQNAKVENYRTNYDEEAYSSEAESSAVNLWGDDPEVLVLRHADQELITALWIDCRWSFAKSWCCANWKIFLIRKSPRSLTFP